MGKIRFIAMDVDGTLVDQDKKIRPFTKETLLKAQEAGYTLILASGRPENGLQSYRKELEMDRYGGLLVAYNGSKVIQVPGDKVLYNQALTHEATMKVLDHVKNFEVTVMIDNGSKLFTENLDGVNVAKEAKNNALEVVRVDDLKAILNGDLNKILTSGKPEYLRSVFDELYAPFRSELNCMFTAPFYVEFTARNVDKGFALKHVLTSLGYERRHLIAFGDAENDLSMIDFAGVGVAMGNAVEPLKAIADHVTLSNLEDGIAHALLNYLPELN